MKTQKSILFTLILLAVIAINSSCNSEKLDPAMVLDEVFIPEGYQQVDNPPADALARLQELRLENPKDHYYYIQKKDFNAEKWIFPQKELKIEFVAHSETSPAQEKPQVLGVVVKKINGDGKEEEFIILENQPAPKDGLNSFFHYIQENLTYPEQAKKMGIEGKVFVQFIVEKDGELTEVKAVKGIGAGCDEEAVRVINETQAWNPATVADMPVKTRMILPITFKLN